MHRRRLVTVAVVLALGAAWLTVGDPLAATPHREPVDLDAPPAVAVHQALSQPAAGDYEATVARRNATGASRTLATYRVENSDRQAIVRTPDVNPDYLAFANDHVTWRGYDGVLERSGDGFDDGQTPYRHVDRVRDRGDAVRRLAANDSVAVYRITDTDLAYAVQHGTLDVTDRPTPRADAWCATLTVAVDRADRTLARARFDLARNVGANGTVRETVSTVTTFDDWGTTRVRRPAGAGYSLAEFLRDAVSW